MLTGLTPLIHGAYKYILKPVFFQIDPETMHDAMTTVGSVLGQFGFFRSLTRTLFAYKHPSLRQTVAGLHFPNPVGLAAGFDKNAKIIRIIPEVGFGFEEVGTITYGAYEGNPPPRLYRLPRSRALVVNYGLKNEGAGVICARIKKTKHLIHTPIGISIGKTNSPVSGTREGAIEDYVRCLETVQHTQVGDFYVLNISCPNMFGGEPFTVPASLEPLLRQTFEAKPTKPVFIKMPSDRPWNDFKELLDIILKFPVTGVIICNLNKNRADAFVKDPIPTNIKGSISGKPVEHISNDLISRTYQYAGQKLIIIGVGGIFSAQDAYEKIKRGATLVQLITGMIYEGPQVIGEINRGLTKLLRRDGYRSLSEAVGAYYRDK